MHEKSFQLRLSDKKKVWISSAIIIATFVIVHKRYLFGPFIADLMFTSGALVWLPVMLSYVFSYFIKNKEYDIGTLQRCIIFLFAGILNIIFSSFTEDPESAGLSFLSYSLIYPMQVTMILIFDFLFLLTRKYGK